jgi:predicted regulator of Ras-like GTPase activity (Roadblock/LC7/MglB family)
MGFGGFTQSIVDTPVGKMLAAGAGDEAILVTIVRNEANMGLILMSVEKAVQSIALVLEAAEAIA